MRRPPSMDYKPRRSESEDPGKGPFTVVKKIKKPDGTVITETTKTVKVEVASLGCPCTCLDHGYCITCWCCSMLWQLNICDCMRACIMLHTLADFALWEFHSGRLLSKSLTAVCAGCRRLQVNHILRDCWEERDRLWHDWHEHQFQRWRHPCDE